MALTHSSDASKRLQHPILVHPHSPRLNPRPNSVLATKRKHTVIETSGTSENDALMQYLLRPISILPCFISDAQSMAEARGFGTSTFHRPPYLLTAPLCRP